MSCNYITLICKHITMATYGYLGLVYRCMPFHHATRECLVSENSQDDEIALWEPFQLTAAAVGSCLGRVGTLG